MEMYILAIIAMLYGQIEKHIYNNGYSDTSKHLFNKLSIKYHIPLILMWGLICYGMDALWFLPMFMVIEDIFYFVENDEDELGPDSWINFGLGGFRLFDLWIPTMYIIGLFSSLILKELI